VDEDDRARPLVVHGHGYGGQVAPQWAWAAAGLHVVGIDVRGFGASPAPRDPGGYVLTGLASPETHILRGAVCDYLRSVEVAHALLAPRVACTILHGASFAGALATMAEALLGVADLLVLAVPSLAWHEGRRFLVRTGSGAEVNAHLERRPARDEEDVMLVLRYFDAMRFADRVRSPTLVGVGEADDVVPAATVRALAARIAGPTEVMTFPVSHSNAPEEREWEAFDARWLGLARDGVPADFGAHPDSAAASRTQRT
jgi:cephalosporin-C deacetylase